MPLRGRIDTVSHTGVRGWAWDNDAPDTFVSLYVAVNDEVVERCLADRHRPDLEKAAIGKGRHGFDIIFAAPLSPVKRQTITVRRGGDGAHLTRTPCLLEPASGFNRETQEYFVQILSAVADEDALARWLSFLAA